MGNILVIKDRSVDFSAVAVERVSFLNDGPVIRISGGVVTIIPFKYTVATYYTTDGSEPTSSSNAYNAPFSVSTGITVKAVSVYPDGHYTEISAKINDYWSEVDLTQYNDTGKTITAELNVSNSTSYFESYVIPVVSGKTMRITACVWGNTSQEIYKYSPCAVYLNNQSVESSSIISAASITPTTTINDKLAACYDKVEFIIPSNTPYLFIQSRTQENANFVDGYDLKLEEYSG